MTDAVPITALRRRLIVGALACTMACSGAPEPEKVLTTVRSWTATTELASVDVRRGAITKRLASQLRDRAAEAREASAAALAQGVRSPEDRRRTTAVLDSLDSSIRALGAAGGGR